MTTLLQSGGPWKYRKYQLVVCPVSIPADLITLFTLGYVRPLWPNKTMVWALKRIRDIRRGLA